MPQVLAKVVGNAVPAELVLQQFEPVVVAARKVCVPLVLIAASQYEVDATTVTPVASVHELHAFAVTVVTEHEPSRVPGLPDESEYRPNRRLVEAFEAGRYTVSTLTVPPVVAEYE